MTIRTRCAIQFAGVSVYREVLTPRPAAKTTPSSLVTRQDLEAQFTALRHVTRDPQAGIFGPASVSWKLNREAAVFLGAGRAALLQLAHPWVTHALNQHSNTLNDPIGRFHGTFRVIYTMLFGSLPQALAASRGLHALHTRIRGEVSDSAATLRAGRHYEANHVEALVWVFATLVESAVLAYGFVLPPLTGDECERYYAETKHMAALFGIPAAALPPDWAAFLRYCAAMHASDILGVDPLARTMAHRLLAGSGSWVRPPGWYRALTAWWLPPRFRQEFALVFSAREQRIVERTRRWLPPLYRSLPARMRQTGPYFEALERMRSQPPSLLTRMNNRFWMGQNRLMYADIAQGEDQNSGADDRT
jgi:uncharacterized protein (DUF2236 family)